MFILYVDESGDVGLSNSPSKHFVLSGLVIHELSWKKTLDLIIQFRKDIKKLYDLKLNEEIHGHAFLHRPGGLARIPKFLRMQIIKKTLAFEASLSDISIINVIVDKGNKIPPYNTFECAWGALVQRFHNTIHYRNFPGPKNPEDRGLLVVDSTDGRKLQTLIRRMRRYNPVPNMGAPGYRMISIDLIVDDPFHRDSRHSYFIQLCDINAFALYQKTAPCGYIHKKGGRTWFNLLNPILCKHASRSDPFGVVRL